LSTENVKKRTTAGQSADPPFPHVAPYAGERTRAHHMEKRLERAFFLL